MAEIKTYDTSQVQERALPSVQQESAVTPDALGRMQEGTIRTGAALLGAGSALAGVAYQMQEKENLEAVQAATTAYGEQVLNFKTDAQKNRTLHGAAGLSEKFTEFHQKTLGELERGLKNNEQRRAFRAVAQRTGLAARQDVASFEITETNKAGIITHKANQQTTINIGSTALTDDVANESKQQLINMTRAFAASRNMDEVSTRIEVEKAVAEFHANRVHHLARTDPEGALNYFKKFEKEIADPEVRGKIGAFADKAGAEGMGVRKGGEVFSKFFDGNDKTPLEVDKMKNAAREDPALKNNPAALQATLSNIDERARDVANSRTERANATMGKINAAILNGASMSQIRGMPEFMALPDTKQRETVDFIERRQLNKVQMAASYENLADARESRKERRLTREAYPEVLALMTNPERLAAMSKNDILAKLTTYGVEHTQHLLAARDKFASSQAALSEGKIDNDTFKMMAATAGMDVDKAKGEDARRLVGLRARVEQQIGIAQQRAGGKLDDAAKREIMQREIDNVVLIDRTFLPDPERAVGTLSKAERKNAYVVVNGQEIRLQDIPEDHERRIIAALRRQNLPTDMKSIATMWAAQRRPKDGLK